MTKRYNVKTSGGSSILPVANGEHFTDMMGPSQSDGEVYLEFFNTEADAGDLTNAVTPIAGTVTVSASPMGNVFIRDAQETVINAADVSSPDAAYTPPIISGTAVRGKVVLSSISGASFVRIIFARRDS